MKLSIVKNVKVICFAAGAAAVIVGKKAVKSSKVRKACVNCIAKGMKLRQDAMETLQNMKEEAEDICYEARTVLDEDEPVD